jgi:hypothetical protein
MAARVTLPLLSEAHGASSHLDAVSARGADQRGSGLLAELSDRWSRASGVQRFGFRCVPR